MTVHSSTMRGIAIDSFSEATETAVKSGKLQMRTFSIPEPSNNEVLIEIFASCLNPVDNLIRIGTFKQLKLPLVLGVDLSGRVLKIGKDVSKFKVGDEVFAHTKGLVGTFAEFALLPEKLVALKPQKISHIEAAAVPCAALTAFQVLTDELKIIKGETVLITGAAGGVGTFAVQIAATVEAHVIATGSQKNREFLHKLGAKEVIDYTKYDYTKAVRKLYPNGVDVALTTVSNKTKEDLPKAVRDQGRIAWISSEDPEGPVLERGIKGNIFYAQAEGSSLNKISELIDSDKVKVYVKDVINFNVEEVARALDILSEGHVQGKLVIEIKKCN